MDLHQSMSRYILIAGIVSLGISVILAIFRQYIIAATFAMFGVGLAFQSYRWSRLRKEDEQDQAQSRLDQHRANAGKVIYVSLVDDDGNPLPHDVAQQRLRIAEAQAGPRDTVLGVKHKI